MTSIQDQLDKIKNIRLRLEDKIKKTELTKSDLDNLQVKLDGLEKRTQQSGYTLQPSELVAMLEVQILINIAKGDLKQANLLTKECLQIEGGGQLIATNLVKELAENIHDGHGNNSNGQISKSHNIPEYFTVTTIRLLLLNLITVNLYSVYWFYKNWKVVERFENLGNKGRKKRLFCILSSIFFSLTSYELFTRLRNSGKQVGSDEKISAGTYAWGVFLLHLVWLSVFPLISIQGKMNKIKELAFNDAKVHKGINIGEVLIVIAAISYFGVLIATSSDSDTTSSNSPTSIERNSTTPFTSTQDRFTVNFPEPPEIENTSVEKYGRTVPLTQYTTGQGSVVYLVQAVRFSSDYDLSDEKPILERGMNGFIETLDDGKITSSNYTIVEGNTALDGVLSGKSDGVMYTFRTRNFIEGNTMYSIVTSGISELEYNNFRDSFKLNR